MSTTLEPIISADSHIAEVEACYADIDPNFRDVRPRAANADDNAL